MSKQLCMVQFCAEHQPYRLDPGSTWTLQLTDKEAYDLLLKLLPINDFLVVTPKGHSIRLGDVDMLLEMWEKDGKEKA